MLRTTLYGTTLYGQALAEERRQTEYGFIVVTFATPPQRALIPKPIVGEVGFEPTVTTFQGSCVFLNERESVCCRSTATCFAIKFSKNQKARSRLVWGSSPALYYWGGDWINCPKRTPECLPLCLSHPHRLEGRENLNAAMLAAFDILSRPLW